MSLHPGNLAAQPDDPNEKKTPMELASYNWEDDARKQKLSEAEIALLKKQGVLVTGQTYKQIFEPYEFGTQVFITSDTVINAYSVLLEDSILRLERVNAGRLNQFLEMMWRQLTQLRAELPASKFDAIEAVQRAQIMIGVALELSSGRQVEAPPVWAKTIHDEAQRVIAATGQSKPDWLGRPDSGFVAIDYTRFQPRGFYAGSAKLERYFRATSWLQAIPFRFDNDQELRAFMAIYDRTQAREPREMQNAVDEMRSLARSYSMLLGEPDNSDLFGGSSSFRASFIDPGYLAEVREKLTINDPQDRSIINDQIATPGKDGKPERTFRILGARRVPDAVLFAKTESVRQAPLPSGLQVAAALGSPTARARYEKQNAALLKEIDAQKELFSKRRSLYTIYLNVLSTLLQPVDKAAPPLFHGPAWQEKSLQTFLGGWAQARHAWVLQTKQNFTLLGMGLSVPSGFVEPVPDFFSKMANLMEYSQRCFLEANAYVPDNQDAVEQIQAMIEALKRFEIEKKKKADATLSEEDEGVIITADRYLQYVSAQSPTITFENITAAIPRLEKLAAQLEKEGPGSDVSLQTLLSPGTASPEANWSRLVLLCAKLEALSQKQLRGVAFSEEDHQYLSDYGEKLARIMFYEGNSWEQPRDDAPRSCDIAKNSTTGQVLHVGIGRPRQIYVLYPYGGKDILTHGAVFPYYEFSQTERLTDKTWKELLSSPAAPPAPEWLGGIMQDFGMSR